MHSNSFYGSFDHWFHRNQKIVNEAVDLFKNHLEHDRGLIRLLSVGMVAFLFSLMISNKVIQESYPILLTLKAENLSPATYDVVACFYVTLFVIVSASERFSRCARHVRRWLDISCYSGAVLFGLLFGDLAYVITVSEEIEVARIGVILFAYCLLQTAFLLCFQYLLARSLDAESLNRGFMRKWWTCCPILRYGFPLSYLLLAGGLMALRYVVL